jgi:hypothetical protein
MQPDGNLVLYVIDDGTLPQDITQGQYFTVLWASNTEGAGFTCEMQNDGNLVVYNEDCTRAGVERRLRMKLKLEDQLSDNAGAATAWTLAGFRR